MRKAMMLGLFLFVISSSVAFAEDAMPAADAVPAVAAVAVVDAGNTLCPVGGEKVSGTDFVEVNGKRYGICCAMCADKLKKNPEKYLTETTEIKEPMDMPAVPEVEAKNE